jgi:phosphatidylglycerol---prolipoprotein diacylglyceryl transferase
MFPYLRIGPFLLQTTGLALLMGFWIGSTLIEKESRRLRLNAAAISNLLFYGLIAGLIGARLGYVARYLSIYLAYPLSLLSLNPNTLSISDGLLIGCIVAIVYGQRKKLPLRPTLDALVPGLAAFLVALGVAHFLSGDAFGAPSRLPWSIYLWNEYRHPWQIYETLTALAIFLFIRKRPYGLAGEGLNFLLFVALSAFARVLLEPFRGDGAIIAMGFRSGQVISLILLAGSLGLLDILKRSGQRKQGRNGEGYLPFQAQVVSKQDETPQDREQMIP